MSYTDPPDFNGGDVLTEADLDVLSEDIRDLNSRVSGVVASIVQVTRSANQSFSDSTEAYVTWTAEQFDIGGWWSSGTKIIVPASAIPTGATSIIVCAAGQFRFATNSTGIRRVNMHVNGASQGGAQLPGLSGDSTFVPFFEAAEVEALDEIQFAGYQTSGGALNMTTAKITLWRHGVAS